MPLRYIVPDTCAIAASLYNELYSANTDPLLQAIRQRTVVAVADAFSAEIWTIDTQFTAATKLIYASITDLKVSAWV